MTNHVLRRMYDHNVRGHGWTKRYRPWSLLLSEMYVIKVEALKREKALKSARGRQFIREQVGKYR